MHPFGEKVSKSYSHVKLQCELDGVDDPSPIITCSMFHLLYCTLLLFLNLVRVLATISFVTFYPDLK